MDKIRIAERYGCLDTRAYSRKYNVYILHLLSAFLKRQISHSFMPSRITQKPFLHYTKPLWRRSVKIKYNITRPKIETYYYNIGSPFCMHVFPITNGVKYKMLMSKNGHFVLLLTNRNRIRVTPCKRDKSF